MMPNYKRYKRAEARKRERRLNDPEFMGRLRQRFYHCPAVGWTYRTDRELYDTAGDSVGAALIDVSLAFERLRKEICRRLQWRK